MALLKSLSSVFLMIAVGLTCRHGLGQENTSLDSSLRDWSEVVAKQASQFKLYLSDDDSKMLPSKIAYEWANPARPKVLGERLFLIYTDGGRPVASCKIYPTGNSVIHAFISMTDKSIVCKRESTVVWSPPPSGIEFASVPSVSSPSPTASRRKIELKSISREFTATMGKGEAQRQKSSPHLRLLPTPIYQYELVDEGKEGVFDGAVFGFVAEGGNPELLLLVEAVRTSGESTWRYAFARRSIAEMKGFHQGAQVWQVEFIPANKLNDSASFHKISMPAE